MRGGPSLTDITAKLRRQELRYKSCNPEQDKVVLIRIEGGEVAVWPQTVISLSGPQCPS